MSKGALGLLSAYWPEDTPRYAHIPLKTLAEVTIHANAEAAPGRAAIVGSAGALTYGDLSARVRRFGDALRNRVERGSRVHKGQLLVILENADLSAAAEQSKGEKNGKKAHLGVLAKAGVKSLA